MFFRFLSFPKPEKGCKITTRSVRTKKAIVRELGRSEHGALTLLSCLSLSWNSSGQKEFTPKE